MSPKPTLKRPLLFLLSLVVASFVGLSLVQSFTQPQVQDRLTVAQTYLTLQASELKIADQEEGAIAKLLLGESPYTTALKQYDPLLTSTATNLDKLTDRLQDLSEAPARATSPAAIATQRAKLLAEQRQQQQLLNALRTEAGLLQALEGDAATAQRLWQQIPPQADLAPTAAALTGLWNDPPRLLPEAEANFKRQLRGWFRGEALERLYTLEQRQQDLLELVSDRQAEAEATLTKLAFVVLFPIVSALIGAGLLLALLVQAWRSRRHATSPNWVSPDPAPDLTQSPSPALRNPFALARWQVPWDGSWLLIGLLGGFFLVGQIIISSGLGGLVFALVNGIPQVMDNPIRAQAFGVLCIYGLMATGVLGFLYLCLRQFRPLPPDWFRLSLTQGHWFAWGLGGYFVAYPLVLLVSLLNQQIWSGQGGSNPLLTLALENQDQVALVLFFVTAAIAAPLFEEIFFRGFLLASLTRFMPPWGAVVISALIFALAHLSLSELLPLMTLGCVLGFVYGRSRNLLASILLHGLWNSGTLVSLFVLGSALHN